MPPEREDDISDDVDETESQLARRVGAEMNWQEEVPQLPPSPLAAPPSPLAGPPSPSGKSGKTSAAEGKGKKSLKRSGDDARKEVKKTKTKKVVKTNSEMFPASMRPEMFADDDIFNELAFDKAATFVHEHKMLTTKLEAKAGGKSAHEKSDDTIKKVKIPEGDDDAGENLNIEARKALRPVNKEISEQMSWFVTKYEQVILNVPVDIYGLADSVPTKAIELAHNLASHITIDMFCPGGKRNSTVKHKALKSKDREFAVETMDVYGDIDTIQDVLLAWTTLQAIWQKIFPEWPVCIIAQRVIIKMKNFAHCNHEAKDVLVRFSKLVYVRFSNLVLVRFSNRLLTSSSQSAARRKKPLSYEKAWNLAGAVCMEQGYGKEPMSLKGTRIAPGGQTGGFKGTVKSGQGSQRAARGGLRTGGGVATSR